MDLIPSHFTNNSIESYLIKVTSRSRIIYWIIIFSVLSWIVILPFIYVDVAINARGNFQTEIAKQIILTTCPGKVIFTSLEEGHMVNRGDTLFILESEALSAQKKAVENRILENNNAITDLEKLTRLKYPDQKLKINSFLTTRYFSEYSNMSKSWNTQFQKHLKSEKEYDRMKILHEQEIIPMAEYEKSLYTYKSEVEDLNQILTYRTSLWQADLMQRRDIGITMEAELKEYIEALKSRVILAPVRGRIIQSADIQRGMIVNTNQKLAEISPDGDLIAICYVSPKDIGLITIDQNVKIQVDALNYNEWGFLDANIMDISDDLIIENESNAYYRVKCKPGSSFMHLNNGIKAELKKGMSFSARIVIARRSLLNLLFDKTSKWLNPYLAKSR
jgi:HlyD family secretion protein